MLQISEIIESIENKLKDIGLPEKPAGLYLPVSYMLSMGGKRIRPVLSMIASGMYGNKMEQYADTAVAIEVFHNFTLMHDDIMDKATIRRGMQSVHEKWGLNTAILSGDAMLVKAYELLCRHRYDNLYRTLQLFTDSAAKVCEGQQYDIEFESRTDVTVDEYLEMIRCKTAVLLGCALYCGALAAGAENEEANILYDIGVNAGISFQIKDDLLDLYGNETTVGKRLAEIS